MGGGKIFGRAINFFREDLSEVVGAYFDGEKIFVVRLTESFEAAEIDVDGAAIDQLAEKISLICKERGWRTSAVGFCLREGDGVTFQTDVGNVPAKEISALVRSWATAHAGKDATFAYTHLGAGLWMEALPRKIFDEICAAFEKFGLNLRGLSIMPTDALTKTTPFEQPKFIARLVRERKAPNLLARGNVFDWKRLSAVMAAIFFVAMLIGSANLFIDYRAASSELAAAKNSIDSNEAYALKKTIDSTTTELNRLNKLSAAQNVTPAKFNLLLNLGKVAGGGVSLTKINATEDILELEGVAATPDAVKSYLGRVKGTVIQTARLESSTERDDGKITFVIRATLKGNAQ